ncbi:hypothetical protein [Leptotrichia sp. oral taxon 223]|uniref:hypothetical protein n=1 Tax=Leptotrichia sp. oral taxon 223 TaxID=712363 RepID=UPI0015BDA99C|nr:hypothetical protein [Leptotrichia sp. oral taxon 223]NWO18195.1 hypothetical protein [Leptotrichia sp. oral taxon 223]
MDEKKERISFETELYVSEELKRIKEIESKMGAIFSIENLSMNEIKAYIKHLQEIRREYVDLLTKIEKHLIAGADNIS